MCKKIISAVLTLVLLIGLVPATAIPAFAAESGKSGNISYEIKSGVMTLTGKGAMADYESPYDAPWAKNGDSEKVTMLVLPKGITYIGNHTFRQETFPNLDKVVIEDLKTWATITFKENPVDIAHKLYVGNADSYQRVKEIKASDLNGVTSISAHAFEGLDITSVVLPDSVTTIEACAFKKCEQLRTVQLGANTTSIGEEAFLFNRELQEITVPGSVQTVGPKAFEGCTKLKTATLENGIQKIDDSAFRDCANLTAVALPDTVTTIGVASFEGCLKLKDLYLPEHLQIISDKAFRNCKALGDLYLPASVVAVGGDSFEGCSNMNAVYSPSIEAWLGITFQGINPLLDGRDLYLNGKRAVDVVIPDSVSELKRNAFAGCKSLEKLTLPNLIDIGQNALRGCTNLKEVVVTSEAIWKDILENRAEGNEVLDHVKVIYKPHNPIGPSGDKLNVNEKLVDMVMELNGFHENAYAVGDGYKIGYGTPANKGDKISKSDAKNVLRDYLKMAAFDVNSRFPKYAEGSAKLDALAAFSFINGYDWMKGSLLKDSFSEPVTTSDVLSVFLITSSGRSAGAMRTALCEANLFLNGIYSSTVSSDYGYTLLNPNGGSSSQYGDVVGYVMSKTELISPYQNPDRLNYQFVGWYTAAEGGNLVNTLDASTNGKTLYAHWQDHDTGINDGKIEGKKVSYKLPAIMGQDKDKMGRIKVFANPENITLINVLEANSIMDVVAEYRHPITQDLWVRLKDSGWVNLGQPTFAVESGVVELQPKQRLEIYKDGNGKITATKVGGGLRNGDLVSVTKRDGNWGLTVYLDHETNTYKYGWINLDHVKMNGSTNGDGDEPVSPDSPTGKPAIATGVVSGTENVNVRAKPNVYAQLYTKLARGTKVNIYDKSTTNNVDWAMIDEGWVCMQYILEQNETPEEKPSTPSVSGNVGTDDNTKPLARASVVGNITLNIRTGPGPQHKSAGTLSKDARFDIFQTKMYNGVQWGRMEKGWVCMTYVRLDGDIEIKGEETVKPSKPNTLGQGRVANCSTHVNVRANASAQSALQGSYALGSVIDLLEKTENNGFDWYRTPKGWVCGTYVQPIAAPSVPTIPTPSVPGLKPGTPGTVMTGVVSANVDVNVRQEPGIEGKLIGSMRSGSRVNIYDSQSVNGKIWYKIDNGWMSGDYIIVNGSNPGGSIGGLDGSAGTTEVGKGQYATGTVAQAGVQVYAGPGYGYRGVKKLNLGANITVYEQRLLDGVAWGRIDNTNWVNLAFVTLNATGVTGTGTMGTIARCGHAVNVRNTPSIDGARMATLLIGAPVEILETKDNGNGETWGRTPQGWVNMYYVNLAGEVPTPPLQVPETPKPVEPQKPADKPSKPVDRGIPFNMSGTMKSEQDLLMIPGDLGDYDASIAANESVQIKKLEKVDGALWALIDGGWVRMNTITLSTYVVSNNAQLVWKDYSKNLAIGALNKGEMVTITKLHMDDAQKIWGFIGTDTDPRWIELTAITQPERYEKSFMVKASAKTNGVIVHSEPKEDSEQIGSALEQNARLNVYNLEFDAEGHVWCRVDAGWVKMEDIYVDFTGKVSSEILVVWADRDQAKASSVVNQGDSLEIVSLALNSKGVPMGLITGGSYNGMWIELSGIAIADVK